MHPEPMLMTPRSTLIVAVPGDTPVARPELLSTVIAEVLLLLQVPLTVN